MVERFRPIFHPKHQFTETAHSRVTLREEHYATNKKGTKQNTLTNCNISLIWGLRVIYICGLSQAPGKQAKTQKSFFPLDESPDLYLSEVSVCVCVCRD